jgi:excisionase family DNA binding protein
MQPQTAISAVLKDQLTDPLLSPPKAAEYLGVTVRTLSVWRCVGRYNIPFIKVGRLVKYRKSALDAFLNRRTIGGEL